MMRLRRLEISGFKSFARSTLLEFLAPVTAIVGPNGSGKSNVVEAMRFVLGEQSMKSLRGSSGADLIWNGSRAVSKMNRASVTLSFDNTDRIFRTALSDDGENISLDFDEVTMGREVYTDGSSTYKVNGSPVRLKDVSDILSSVHIGASGHHIISQGEADRILYANPKDRRAMIEEALGLRVYHIRIRESERKLERSKEHMREVESMRRELAPHLKFLKKQVEKIEHAARLREELRSRFHEYFLRAHAWYTQTHQVYAGELGALVSERTNLEAKIHEARISVDQAPLSKLEETISGYEEERRGFAKKRDELSRSLGRIDALLDVAAQFNKKDEKEGERIVTFEEDYVRTLVREVETIISSLEGAENLEDVRGYAEKLRTYIRRFSENAFSSITSPEKTPAPNRPDSEALHKERENLMQELGALEGELGALDEKVRACQADIRTFHESVRENEKSFYELSGRVNEIKSKESMLTMRVDELKRFSERLSEDEAEAKTLVSYVSDHAESGFFEGETRELLDTLRHEIERTKIRLEDLGGGSGDDVLAEYKQAVERDQFLEKELADLTVAIESLETLIEELSLKIEHDFSGGVKKINEHFTELVSTMFGGGHGKLVLVDVAIRGSQTDDGEEENEEEEEGESVIGVSISVSLPRKNIKSLDMLSGGERSLVSIALLFALSQVNPPPFLVLDETDAALDEANSQRYGDMIEKLSKVSQLIVVTHNRETMSRAQILYGVTMGSDGVSQLLSVKFEEAVSIAK